MRPFVVFPLLFPLVLVVLAAEMTFAAPAVRWINRFGDGVHTPLRKVVEETATEVVVEDTDGQKLTIPVWRLIWLEREGADKRDDALLAARRDVRSQHNLAGAKKVLDGAIKRESGWRKHYALATRALLGFFTAEDDASKRAEAFLKEHPDSRFRGVLMRWLTQAALKKGISKTEASDIYVASFLRLGEIGAPLWERCLMLRECGDLYDMGDATMAKMYVGIVKRNVAAMAEKKDDLAYDAMVLAAPAFVGLDAVRAMRRSSVALGRKPRDALRRAEILQRSIGLGLEELRSDVAAEIARLHTELGDAAKADVAWDQADALARQAGDEARRAAIARARGATK